MSKIENHVFFLQLTENLPEHYLDLAGIMNKLNIMLVPVTASDLKEMKPGPAIYVLSVVTNFNELQSFLKARRQFLDFSLLNRKFCLFDVSSFSPISSGEKLVRSNNYLHHPLPISASEICANIALTYFKERGDITIWPGGRRAKLPATQSLNN